MLPHRLREREERFEVDAHRRPEALERGLPLRPARRRPGVIDADVDASEALERLIDESVTCRPPARLAAKRMDPAMRVGELLEALESAATGNDLRTGVGEHRRDAPPSPLEAPVTIATRPASGCSLKAHYSGRSR